MNIEIKEDKKIKDDNIVIPGKIYNLKNSNEYFLLIKSNETNGCFYHLVSLEDGCSYEKSYYKDEMRKIIEEHYILVDDKDIEFTIHRYPKEEKKNVKSE